MAWTKPRLGRKKNGPFFGLELQKFLVSRAMMEGDLMRAMARMGNAITRQYINMLVHNQRAASPLVIEHIGDAMGLSVEERMQLHRAAALDAGYRIGSLH